MITLCCQDKEKGAETGASAQCFSRSLNCEPVPERVCDRIRPSDVVIRMISGYERSETVELLVGINRPSVSPPLCIGVYQHMNLHTYSEQSQKHISLTILNTEFVPKEGAVNAETRCYFQASCHLPASDTHAKVCKVASHEFSVRG